MRLRRHGYSARSSWPLSHISLPPVLLLQPTHNESPSRLAGDEAAAPGQPAGDAGRGGEPVGEGDSWINEPSPTTLSISSVSCAGWRAVAGLPPTAPKTRRDGDAGRNDDGRGDGDRAGIPSSRISSAAGAVSGRVDVGD